MCLSKPINFKVRREGGYYVGYKVFEYRNGKFYNPYWAYSNPKRMDEWLKAYRCTTGIISFSSRDHEFYRPGFHIFKNLRDAMEEGASFSTHEVVLKVYFDEITEKGEWWLKSSYDGDPIKVVVAKYLYIPSDGRIRK